MFIVTRQWLRDNRACYSDARIDALVPVEGLTAAQVLDQQIPAADRVWVLTCAGVLTVAQRVAFAQGCAARAKQCVDAYAADAAARAAARAAYAAAYAADAAADAAYAHAAAAADAAYAADACAHAAACAAADAAADAERELQVRHLRQLLEDA